MRQKIAVPEELCADEAVCFIADRHHVSPQQLLSYFLYREIPANVMAPVRNAIPLEPNEIEILKGIVRSDVIPSIAEGYVGFPGTPVK